MKNKLKKILVMLLLICISCSFISLDVNAYVINDLKSINASGISCIMTNNFSNSNISKKNTASKNTTNKNTTNTNITNKNTTNKNTINAKVTNKNTTSKNNTSKNSSDKYNTADASTSIIYRDGIKDTITEADGHSEGYIIVGETNVFYASASLEGIVDSNTGKIEGMQNVFYKKSLDNSTVSQGNLFFVYNGADGNSSSDFYYSDGKGNRGKAVTNILTIISSNPKIRHWNIICWCGEEACKSGGSSATNYINNLNCWINSEFPHSNIYIVSLSSEAAGYSSVKDNVKAFNNKLKTAFPNNYIDISECYTANQANYIDPIHFNNQAYCNILNEIVGMAKEKTIASYDPSEIGFIIISECHSDVLIWSRKYCLEDSSIQSEIPINNIIAIPSKNIKCPDYWGGGVRVSFGGTDFEAFSCINKEMRLRPNIKYWYITYFVGTNDIRYQGVKSTLSYMKKNLESIENNTFYTDHSIALITTPYMYGQGHSFKKIVDDYDDGQLEYMKEKGMEDNCYDAREDYDSYVDGNKLEEVEFPGYSFAVSGDGIHYYGKQYWTVTAKACNTIYKQMRGL